MVAKKPDSRSEQDRLGEIQIPAGAYYGSVTARSRESLNVTGIKSHPRLVESMLLIKKAAAQTNFEMGRIESAQSKVIVQTCDELLNNQWREQIIADAFHWGAGESLSININEVVANRGSEIAGMTVGVYDFLHPTAHVGLGLANTALYCSAVRLALLLSLRKFEPVLTDLERLLRRKSLEYYGAAVEKSSRRLKETSAALRELAICNHDGATNSGDSMDFSSKVIDRLNLATNLKLRQTDDALRIIQSMSDFVDFSSSLKSLSIELHKIAGYIIAQTPTDDDGNAKHLSECLMMVCYQIMGNDSTVTLAAQAGQVQANVMAPLIAHNMLESMDFLANALHPFNQRCLMPFASASQLNRQNLSKQLVSTES